MFLVLMYLPASCQPIPAASPDSASLEHVAIQLKWYHQFQFAGYYMAVEKGFYEEEGLDVELIEGGPGIDVDREVLEGRSEYGVLASELIVMYANGEPLVVLEPIMQQSIRALMVKKDSGIDSLLDLKGKTIALNMNETPEIVAMLLYEGIPLDQLTIVAKDNESEALFLEGEIDAVVGSIANQPYLFGLSGVDVTGFRPITYGIDFYGDSLFSTQEYVKKNRDQVDRFILATNRGWEYAFEHQEETAEFILDAFAPEKTKEQLLFEASMLEKLVQPDLVELGHHNPHRWQRISEVYTSLGLIEPITSFDQFIYDPTQIIHQQWIYWGGGTILLLITCMVIFYIWNYRLRFLVAQKTTHLEKMNAQLTQEVLVRKQAEEKIVLLNDQLERRVKQRTAELEFSNRELEAFVYSISHDLRAPLRAVNGFSEIVMSEFGEHVSDELAHYLERIQQASIDLRELIDGLLELSRISKQGLRITSIDLSQLSQEAFRKVDPSLIVTPPEFIVAEDMVVNADYRLMEIVLFNLFENAVKFSSKVSNPVIEVGIKETDPEFVFYVKDNGVGFKMDYRDMLFRPFYRLHLTHDFPGIGIGLTFVQRIILRHRGKVWAESILGEGATFFVSLPLHQELSEE